MRKTLLALALLAATPLVAQAPMPVPGSADPAQVRAGVYQVDGAHTQVAWSLNHLGFNVYHGIFGNPTGTLTLDPAKPADAKVELVFPIKDVATTSAALNEHLLKADFFDVAKHPTATFRSTGVVAQGATAKITGDLTLHGVTRPVVLDARFTGAGPNPMSKAPTVGFEATASIKRSEFGMGYGVPAVGDQVDLRITAAFEQKPAA